MKLQIENMGKKQIEKIIKKRKLENLSIIRQIEQIFILKRKYTIRIPKKNTPVILILSGGLDSVITWVYLMSVYELKVYPLFLRRGQRRVKLEENSVDYFYKYFRKLFPELCMPVKKMDAFIPPLAIRFPITIASNEKVGNRGRWRGIPMYSAMLTSVAVQYAYFLEITSKVRARTIFAGFMALDGIAMKDETLTAIRINNLSICELSDDYSWQVIALPIEKEIGFFYNKDKFIAWAASQNIPLEKTRSCIMWEKNHCGRCISCLSRKEAFKISGVKDKTAYQKGLVETLRSIKHRFLH